jgi:cytochrome c
VEGSAPIISTYPKLAGQNKDYLVQQFKDIQSGARDNAADIDAIADYLSKR